MSELNTRYLICEAYAQFENEGMFHVDLFYALADAGINPEKLLCMFHEGTTPPLNDEEMAYLSWAEANVGSKLDDEASLEDICDATTLPLDADPVLFILVECGGDC